MLGCDFAERHKGLGAYTKCVRTSKHILASKSEIIPLSVCWHLGKNQPAKEVKRRAAVAETVFVIIPRGI